ncbi:MAG: hypothetical protein KF816_10200 [Melioribacteraceae bacterium]|nr:hypothetical protein [Melioribacteraceae bacterium]
MIASVHRSCFFLNSVAWINKNLLCYIKIMQLIVFLALTSNIFSQFDYYSLDQGLSQANVRSILQDRNGFLWMGTQDGLNRFDGYQFTKFRKELSDSNSLPGNYISCLWEDQSGLILIGTINGAAIYDPELNKFTRIVVKKENKTISLGAVSSFIKAKDKSFWIGTYYSGVFRIKNNTVTHFINNLSDQNSIGDNFVTSLNEDHLGNIWIGTFGKGLNKYNITTKKIESLTLRDDNFTSKTINALTPFGDKYLLIATTNGLGLLDIKSNRYELNRINGIKNNILTVYCDRKNNIWTSIEGEGVYLFDYKNKAFLKKRFEIKNDPLEEERNIWAIYEDTNSNLWLGTSTNGLIKWKNRKNAFYSYSKKNSDNFLSNYSIRAILVDKSKNIWIGTDNGLNKINSDNNFVQSYYYKPNDETSISDNKIWALAEDNFGNIWVGTQRGLALYDKQNDKFKRFIHRLNTNEPNPVFPIRSFFVDDNNTLWFGTFGAGLFSFKLTTNKFDSHSLSIIPNPEAKKEVVIFQITSDKNNNLWLASASGLAEYHPKTKLYKRYFSGSLNDFTKMQSVHYSILIENDSTFWLGTLGDGLIKFNPGSNQFTMFNDKKGLPNNTIYGILKDRQNNLWLSTNYGISKFNSQSETFKNYDKNDGISSDEFNTGAFSKDSEGNIYFGGIEGLSFFNPDSVDERAQKAKLALSSFNIFDKPLSPGKVYFDAQTIKLEYWQNFFSFEFTALDLTSPMKNEYAYQLKGYDKQWIYSGKRRYAAYTNVEPGYYTLHLKGTNSDRIWNEAGITINIEITPPYWQTIWFRIIIFIFSVLFVLLILNKRSVKTKRDKDRQQNYTRQLIESQENERKRIASELHDGVGQNLVIIKNRAMLGLNNHPALREQMEEILNISSQTINDVRTIAYNLRPYQLGKIGLTKAVEGVIKQVIQTSNFVFEYSLDIIDNSVSVENEIHVYRIVQECLSNGLRHSEAKKVKLDIKLENDRIIINYKDDGIGFDFDTQKENPSGLGFTSLTHRVKLLSGTLNVESASGTGTKILISFPIKKEENK